MTAEARWTFENIPDQSGRIVVVTGANSGIGAVTARELARRGAQVVLACRSAQRAAAAITRIRADVPDARIGFAPLDLGSLASVREFAENWPHERLDVLVNNAGIAMVPFGRTADGFELHFGVNHLGHFALTGLLLPFLERSPEPLVVTVSSEGQVGMPFDVAHLNAEQRYWAPLAYWQSKKANAYFGAELQRRATAAGSSLRSIVVVPGLTQTAILTEVTGRGRLYHAVVGALVRRTFRPPDAGAATSLRAVTDRRLPGGCYVAPSGFWALYGEPVIRNGYRAMTHTNTARDLWELSERLTGTQYGDTWAKIDGSHRGEGRIESDRRHDGYFSDDADRG